MTTLELEHALALAEKGRAIVPVNPHNKRPPFKEWQRHASKDPAKLREWFGRSTMLPAVLCGDVSGITVLDVEVKNGGLEWLDQHRDRLPDTESYQSKSGGVHLVFRCQPGTRTIPLGKIHPGVELRAAGALATYWPAAGLPVLSDAPIADLPAWIMPPAPPPPAPLKMPVFRGGSDARRYAEAAMARAIREVASAAPGTRNASLNAATYSLLRLVETGAVTAREIAGAMAHAGAAAGLPPREIETTLASALRARGGAA